MSVIFLLTFFGVLTLVFAQISFPGKCNNVTTQNNFNMTKYMGTWYEIKKYPTIFQSGGSCIKVEYTLRKNKTIRVENSMILYGTHVNIFGNLSEMHPVEKDGKLSLNFPDIQIYNSEYWVLGTDYGNYSVVWYCNQENDTNLQFAWVLSRTPNISETHLMEVNKIIESNHLNIDKFLPVNQTSCNNKHRHCTCSSGLITRVSSLVMVLVITKLFFV